MNRKTSLSLLTAALLAGAGADIAAAAFRRRHHRHHRQIPQRLPAATDPGAHRQRRPRPSSRPADFAARTQRVQQLSGDPLQFHHQMGTGAYVYQSGKALSVARRKRWRARSSRTRRWNTPSRTSS